jgi:DNA invertase Pin-like site-specific DNA recombinase
LDIRARTGEGRARAVANGVKMGRKPKMTEHQKREAIRRRAKGEESLLILKDPRDTTEGRGILAWSSTIARKCLVSR